MVNAGVETVRLGAIVPSQRRRHSPERNRCFEEVGLSRRWNGLYLDLRPVLGMSHLIPTLI